MKINILIALLVVCKTIVYSQTENQNKFSVCFGSGLVQQTTHDGLLNYYNYSGNATIPISLTGSYFRNKNLFTLNLLYCTAKLNPINAPTEDYEYNYIEQKNAQFTFEYFREIAIHNDYIQTYIGIENSTYVVKQLENYKSLLYNYGEGFRKSYDVSTISLSPMLLINFRFKRNNLMIKTGFSLLHYAARPDDNYVKQIGLPESSHWNLYGPKKYKNIFFSAVYQYEILHGFGIMVGYNILYRMYSTNDYKYLRNSYLFGITKSF